MPEHDREPYETGTMPAVARFYDTLRSGAVSAAALAHGDANIGQECLLTPEEILDFARRVGITAGTVVLDVGSGTGGPACYLAQQLGCRILGVDISEVGHTQALARARAAELSHLVQFQCGDIATLTLPEAAFDVILGLDAWCHIPQRARFLHQCATLLRPRGRIAFYDHVV
jgi:cyclopropane fatty-acyl-phospholipid synthase-like methyltransferase